MHYVDAVPVLPLEDRLPPGTLVTGNVVCRHGFGIGVRITDPREEFGHVDWPFVSDGPTDGQGPPLRTHVAGVVAGYSGSGQLRLSLRASDIADPGRFCQR
jgi:hypothetical protein